MKISGVKKIKPELIISAFNDFKKEQISNSINKFSYDDFIFFLNTPESQSKYHIIAYKWHRDEAELENENNGCSALSIFNLFEAFIGSNNKLVINDDGIGIKIIKKVDKKLFEFM